MSDGKFVISWDSPRAWSFRLQSTRNHKTVIFNTGPLHSKEVAERVIAAVQVAAGSESNYVRRPGGLSGPRFILKHNGQTLAWSEGYSSAKEMNEAIEWVKANAAGAPVVDGFVEALARQLAARSLTAPSRRR